MYTVPYRIEYSSADRILHPICPVEVALAAAQLHSLHLETVLEWHIWVGYNRHTYLVVCTWIVAYRIEYLSVNRMLRPVRPVEVAVAAAQSQGFHLETVLE